MYFIIFMIKRRFFQQDKTVFDKDNYLTFEALSDDFTFTFSKELEYNVNGDGWNTLVANQELPPIKSGDFVSLRAELLPVQNVGIGRFNIPDDKLCNLSGNCMSLLFGDKANDRNSLKGYPSAFYSLFGETPYSIKEISRKFLPAIELDLGCYARMFYGNEALVNAPELPATTLVDSCYASMFDGCNNLKYIKMLATDISASYCLYGWVDKVFHTGTFVKSKDATWDKSGYSGVPTGWTVIDDTFPTNEDGFPESTEFSFPLYLNFPKEPVYEDEYGVEYELGGDVVSALCDWVENLTGNYYFDSSKAIFINGTPVDSIIKEIGYAYVRGIDEFAEVNLDYPMNMLYGYKEKL